MLQCWAKMPTDRPTFEALKDFLAETTPIWVKAREGQEEEGRMRVSPGDTIIVIDGRSENYWWKGQNQRTFEVGLFARKIVEDPQGKKIKDISKPLKNSFIHTGHGSHQGRSWGRAEAIDELYLRSPMQAADLTGLHSEDFSFEERKLPGRSSMKMKNNLVPATVVQTQQFQYGRLEDERQNPRKPDQSPLRPRRPAPGWNSDRVQAYKSLPDLQKVYDEQNGNLHNREDSLIDLSPADNLSSRLYANTGDQNLGGARSTTSLLDEDIPGEHSSSRHSFYQNQEFNDAPAETFDDGDASFNSLPEGETYHFPPDEDDPFDTSNVVISSTRVVSRYQEQYRSGNYGEFTQTSSDYLAFSQGKAEPEPGGFPDLSQSGSGDENENKPSIISQLLASSSQSGTPPPAISLTPSLQISSTPEPESSRGSRNYSALPEGRHRRAVSTTSEADTFLPPLTSPFSPPAFNPYDIVLGSNEAIAGLDSPSPYPSSYKPKRQTLQNSAEAFSWLNDKIGDMKISQKSDKNVFQFPSVSNNSEFENKPSIEDMYATIKRKPEATLDQIRVDKYSNNVSNAQPLTISQPSNESPGLSEPNVPESTPSLQYKNNLSESTARTGNEDNMQPHTNGTDLEEFDIHRNFQTQANIYSSSNRENDTQPTPSNPAPQNGEEKNHQQQQQQQQQQYQEQQQLQHQKLQQLQWQQQQSQKLQQQQQEQQQLKLQQQQKKEQLERQRQQDQLLEQQKILQQKQIQEQLLLQQMHKQKMLEQQQQQQLVHQRLMQQQQQQQNLVLQREKELELRNLEKIQQHRLEKERKRSEEERRRMEEDRRRVEEERRRAEEERRRREENELRQREAALRSRLEPESTDVFHFPQFSTVSTAGASLPTYAVDSNFIRDLEKNLGHNESKF